MVDKTKSLSENISNLLNSAPKSFDEDEVDETSAKVSFFEHIDDDFGEVERSKIRQQNVDLLESTDKKYAGKVASRKTLRESSDESEEELSDDLGQQSPDDSESDEIPEDDDGEEESTEEGGSEISHSEEEDEDENTDLKHIKHSPEEKNKGLCVRNQLRIWEQLLELRIQFHKCLAASNKMPTAKVFTGLYSTGGEDYKNKLSSAKNSICTVLNKMVDLQTLLVQQNPETKKIFSKKRNCKRKVEESDEEILSEEEESVSDEEVDDEVPKKKMRRTQDFEETISERHNTYKSYSKAVIQKWNDKTRIGTLSKNNSNAHSILNQIENILSDKSKLIKKTQLKRSSYEIIGEVETEENEMYNENIYDDDDFYHQLLRELIEFKSSDVNDPVQLGRQWIKLQNMRSKMKRKVDTKATKGRKLRFTVHTKLVNYMAPIENSTWTDSAKNELYNSLFGKKHMSKKVAD